MQIEHTKNETVAVFNTGATLTAADVDAFRDACFAWTDEHAEVTVIVINMAETTFMDSSGLGVLIALLKHMAGRGGDVTVAALRDEVRMVFEITRAYKIFEIFDTASEAMVTSG